MNSRTKSNETTNSFLIAAMLSVSYIASMTDYLIGINGIGLYLNFVFLFISLLVNRTMTKHYIYFILLTCLLPIISISIYGFGDKNVFESSKDYVQAIILCVYCVSHGFNFKLTAKYLIIIFVVFSAGFFFYDIQTLSAGEKMGLSYAFLPILLASTLCLFYLKTSLKIKLMSIYVLCIFAIFFLSVFTRGAWLALVVFIIILFVKKNFQKGLKGKILNLSLLAALIVVVIYWKDIIFGLNSYMSEKNINIRIIEKMAKLIELDNVDNGRLPLYNLAIKGFFSSPLWGNGVGAFTRQTGEVYEHNVFLQLLNEGGILFSIFHFMMLGKAFYIIVKGKDEYRMDYILFLTFLICNSMVRLMLSNQYWGDKGYWLFIYLAFDSNRFKINNKRVTQKNSIIVNNDLARIQ